MIMTTTEQATMASLAHATLKELLDELDRRGKKVEVYETQQIDENFTGTREYKIVITI